MAELAICAYDAEFKGVVRTFGNPAKPVPFAARNIAGWVDNTRFTCLPGAGIYIGVGVVRGHQKI